MKTTYKKVVHKAGEFLGNKTEDAVTKSNDDKILKQVPVEEVILVLDNIYPFILCLFYQFKG